MNRANNCADNCAELGTIAQYPAKPRKTPQNPAKREKVFGPGRPRPMDRNAKARLMTLARALMRRREKGKAYGPVTAKTLAVLEALAWTFHNAGTGLCFPSYERIAEAAGCARSTAQKAVEALEACGLLSWINRLVRRRVHGPGGWRWRVMRTSNGYRLTDPREPARSSNTERRSGTSDQAVLDLRKKEKRGGSLAITPPSAVATRAFGPGPLDGKLDRLLVASRAART